MKSLIILISFLSFAQADELSSIKPFLEKYCTSCHDEDVQKGNLRLDNLYTLKTAEKLDILNKVHFQVYSKEMPPKKKKKQPSEKESHITLSRLSKYLKDKDAHQLSNRMRKPNYGNLIDHDKLFSGEIKDKAFTPERSLLISNHAFQNFIFMLFHNRIMYEHRPIGIKYPFRLARISGVRDYDIRYANTGHFLTMKKNAEIISYAQLNAYPKTYTEREKQKQAIQEKKLSELDLKSLKGKEREAAIMNIKRQYAPTKIARIGNRVPKVFNDILNSKPPSDSQLEAAIEYQFKLFLQRSPREDEILTYTKLAKDQIKLAGVMEGFRNMLETIIMEPEFLYRFEYGEGANDKFGRKKLSTSELAKAISYTLTDLPPDLTLLKAAKNGELNSREGIAKQLSRLLTTKPDLVDSELKGRFNTPHKTTQKVKLRFFREFFGYYKAVDVFKDDKRFQYGGGSFQTAITHMINDADLMIDEILLKDKEVFKEILTTDKFYLYHNGNNEETLKEVNKRKRQHQNIFSQNWQRNPKEFRSKNFKILKNHLHVPDGPQRYNEKTFLSWMTKNSKRILQKNYSPVVYATKGGQSGQNSKALTRITLFNFDHNMWNYPAQQPFKIPNRKGILTHPVWLVAHSQNTETDPVVRGKFIREKLLAGFIPEVPITVDAAIPEDHNKTLRQRIDSVTLKSSCWKCHERMNPLGYPFEVFDDMGRFRKRESLEHPEHLVYEAPEKGAYSVNKYKTLPIDSSGYINGTGEKGVDGKVKDAFELIDRLANSTRVRQSIVRHAFRYFMKRNEMLSDSQTLIAADKAYVESGGSFNALIISLLTSDSFLYRKEITE